MSIVEVTLTMAEGTTTSAPTQNAGSGNTWEQGKEYNETTKTWSDDSAYWYFYRHKKDNGAEQAGGEVDLEDGGTFRVYGKSSEEIVNVVPHETVEGASNTLYYTVTGPTATIKYWSVADTEHTDPDADNPDTFDVFARDKAGDPVVMCDPIIRNKNNS